MQTLNENRMYSSRGTYQNSSTFHQQGLGVLSHLITGFASQHNVLGTTTTRWGHAVILITLGVVETKINSNQEDCVKTPATERVRRVFSLNVKHFKFWTMNIAVNKRVCV